MRNSIYNTPTESRENVFFQILKTLNEYVGHHKDGLAIN